MWGTTSDVTLLAADGDQGAWVEIVDRYTPPLILLVLRYRLPSSGLHDVAQTVWLRIVEHLGDLRDRRALPMWLITTVKREALRAATVRTRVQPVDHEELRLAEVRAAMTHKDRGDA